MNPQSERSPKSASKEERNITAVSIAELSRPTAAEYVYRIAAITAGIFLLATVV
jgi:hypothetical protein